MKILILFCLFVGLTKCDQGKPNDKCWLQCDYNPYVAVVKCPGVDEVGKCTICSKGDTEAANDDCKEIPAIQALTNDLTWEKCQELAGSLSASDAELKSDFFRWEKKESNEAWCYFLKDCEFQIAGACSPFPDQSCVSGPSGEGNCEEDPKPTCPVATWNPDGLHWTCSLGSVPINPYKGSGEDKLVEKGTLCQTDGDGCSTWTWSDDTTDRTKPKVAHVKCGGENGDTNDWQTMIRDEVDTSIHLDLNTNDAEQVPPTILPNLNDGFCRCEKLDITMETYQKPGLSLLCEPDVYNPEDLGIETGTACGLLCDGHFKMYIECYRGKWMNTAIYEPELVTADSITC